MATPLDSSECWAADAESDVDNSVASWLGVTPSRPPSTAPSATRQATERAEPLSSSKMSIASGVSAISTDSWKDTVLGTDPFWNAAEHLSQAEVGLAGMRCQLCAALSSRGARLAGALHCKHTSKNRREIANSQR
jgi:hypothetical protein